ncbi:MAG: KTSC domain-containing protein [Sphingomonas sp.]
MPSSVIRDWSYDERDRALDIRFVNGRRYRYLEVPERLAAGMRAADSKGIYFNDHIRDRFAFTRL